MLPDLYKENSMFNNSNEIDSFVDGIQRVKMANDDREFQKAVHSLCEYMKQQQMSPASWQRLDKISFYIIDEASDTINLKNRSMAKERVVAYITELLGGCDETDILYRVLNNFYEYLEALRERDLHGKATLSKNMLESIVVNNEYDMQFLLFAYLKPIFPKERLEVNKDTGYETVRADILINEDTCIEVKCSRSTMQEKLLGEQIKADMVHYKQKNIFFFIYDKDKIIKNPLVFKESYEKMVSEKKIFVIIHQPKML